VSHSVTLYCAETKQAVHVAERSSSWFRSADYPIVVGAFCLAHCGKPLQSTLAFSEFDDNMEYKVWMPENVQEAYTALTGSPLERLAERLTPPYL